MNDIKALYSLWKEKAVLDSDLQDELNSIEGDEEAILDRFYKNLEFGTGGLRGVIGAGTNRMNVYTVAQATQGLANYLNEEFEEPSVAIGYDSRIKSQLFAETAAGVLAANGIKVYIYPELMPTPMISYAVMRLHCSSGIVITASHNPASYNGIKLIIREGRDAPVELTEKLENIIANTDSNDIDYIDFDICVEKGLVKYLTQPFNSFVDNILSKLDIDKIRNRDLRVLFNPMHGSGTHPLMTILYTARCTVDLIDSEKDAYFGGHDPAPSGKSMSDFSRHVIDGKYDLGMAVLKDKH